MALLSLLMDVVAHVAADITLGEVRRLGVLLVLLEVRGSTRLVLRRMIPSLDKVSWAVVAWRLREDFAPGLKSTNRFGSVFAFMYISR